ncbi:MULTISPECIES: hypothetical protein [Roseateles]|uniref:Uncharacterized protein n=1 Tax=Roseateles albus TaxID=2987525 RepID=A0ABT5KG83_9BURK|nr:MULTISPECIES: hypothetical protein [Roseateles]MCV2360509.1 hypothetical protein [Paucibacter sp. TC2R-5]MDC8771811.1 hypothetical protein [Roseateles albus]
MSLRNSVFALLALSVLCGLAEGTAGSFGLVMQKPFDVVSSLLFMLIGYLWYRQDAQARQYRGSSLLGGAIIMASVLAIPYYLAKSRPSEQRGKAIGSFIGLVLLAATSAGIAAVLADLLRAS